MFNLPLIAARTLALLLFLFGVVGNLPGAVFNVADGDIAGFKAAITTANSNGEDNTINLATNGNYLFTAPDNSGDGVTALPPLGTATHALTVNGNGSTLARTAEPYAPNFRFFACGGSVTVLRLTFSNGSAVAPLSEFYVPQTEGWGGAITGGPLTISDCTFVGNGAEGWGGAIYGDGLIVNNCLFLNNAANNGGAIAAGNATITNSTFVQNAGYKGHAVFSTGTTIISHCTLSNNREPGFVSPGFPGIVAASQSPETPNPGTVVISNSILTTFALAQSSGNVVSKGYNVADDEGAGYLTATGDQTSAYPLLGPLSDNGGPTQTLPLLDGSSALDAGNPADLLMVDQRGLPRPVDGNGDGLPRTDAGAYERQPNDRAGFVVTTLDDHDDGKCDATDCTLREAINAANSKEGDDVITFSPGLSGVLNLTSPLPVIAGNVVIAGPGAKRLTIRRSAGGNYGLFVVDNGNKPSSQQPPLPVVSFSGLTLSNGSTSAGAVLFDDYGTISMTDCVIAGNAATYGALFINGGSLSLVGCTLSSNAASSSGGAIYLNAAGSATLTNCTLANNSATTGGGAIYGNDAKAILTTNCTFSSNTAMFGSSLGLNKAPTYSYAIRFYNSIFSHGSTADNFGTADASVPTVTFSGGHNISSDSAYGDSGTAAGGVLNQTGDLRNTDPALDPAGLKDNGGDTPTIAIGAGPAIDAAGTTYPFASDPSVSSAAPSRDQRGFLKSGVRDIGAFELNGVSAGVTVLPGLLGNISTRVVAQTGDDVPIAGFIITGSQPKQVIIRGIGPSLQVAGALGDPYLELDDEHGAILGSNDNWSSSANKQDVINTGVAPTNNLESAIVTTLPANKSSYTAIVRGTNNTTGIALAEVYDLDNTVDSKLANISTRGLVQGGDNVMIGGFIVVGDTSRQVLIRGIGPSLQVPGPLADPSLELYDGNGTLLEANDNWTDSSNKQAIINSGIAPTNNLESAIVRTLPRGSYTAIVRGVNGSTGIGLVEIYALD